MEPRISTRRTIDLPAEVRVVRDALVSSLGDDLSALLWHGSEARGEAKPDSDHDLIIILKRMDSDTLRRMQQSFSRPRELVELRSDGGRAAPVSSVRPASVPFRPRARVWRFQAAA